MIPDVVLLGFAYVVVGFIVAATLLLVGLMVARAHMDGMRRVRNGRSREREQ